MFYYCPGLLASIFCILMTGPLFSDSEARIETIGSPPDEIKVLYVFGEPYQMGYDHGRLLRKEIQVMTDRFLRYFIQKGAEHAGVTEEEAVAKIDEVVAASLPFIPENILEEMRGLADGAEIPLEVVHRVHAIPTISEMNHCSAFAAWGKAVPDGKMVQTRILDWAIETGCQDYPLITVYQPADGIPFCTIGWCGFVGAVTGLNAERLGMSEMTGGNAAKYFGEEETTKGIPMIFLFREVLRTCSSLQEALDYVKNAKRDCSFFYILGDADDQSARLLLTTPGTYLEFTDNDKSLQLLAKLLLEVELPVFEDIVYGSHFNAIMAEKLSEKYGEITVDYARDTVAPAVMIPKSNLQSVVYNLTDLEIWVANAEGLAPAAKQVHVFFDFGAAIGSSRLKTR